MLRKIILPWQVCVIAILIAAALFGIQFFIYQHTTLEDRVVANYTCKVDNYEAATGDSYGVNLKLNCSGKKYDYNDDKVVVSYFKNPGPIECLLKANGWIRCNPRPKIA